MKLLAPFSLTVLLYSSSNALVLPRHSTTMVQKAPADIGKKFASAALAASLFFAPLTAEAASSGGRIGSGSRGFSRSAPSRSYSSPSRSFSGGSSRSYSSPGRSYAPGPTILNINPGYGFSPFYSPFGFGGFGGYYGGAGVFGIPQLVAWPLFFYLAFQVARNFVDGAQDRLGSFWDSGAAAGANEITVVRLNVAVNLPDRANSVIGRLAAIAASDAGGAAGKQGNLYSVKKMGELTSEVALTLLRQRSNWQAANFDATAFRSNVNEAELAFNKRVIFERSKFDNENPVGMLAGQIAGPPTLAVVTMVVGLKGSKGGVLGDVCNGRARVTEANVVELLETIAAEASTSAYSSADDPTQGLVSAEILWTPSSPDEVLSREQVLLDYPELIDL